ncbi:hypothetical protein SAMN05192551_1124 [Tindallia magadiensis]|uniref:DUF5673 domain-containing protein n=1 Tax=Tindallia magadiensis TaxID=69895 RepID=A0A1I3H849_9FIRM|nr:hypothetical protein [Tindallia magadiensis]SFI31928.1 hypothetical protein SAMN05192551_1124 [Tindallia magadiensis]
MFILLLFTYQLFRLINILYIQWAKAGKKLASFSQKSGLRWLSTGLFFLGLLMNYFAYVNHWHSLIGILLFQGYLSLILWESWSFIHFYEKGIIFSGRFVSWEEIKEYKKVDEDSYLLEIGKNPLKAMTFRKVSQKKSLERLLNHYLDIQLEIQR